MAWYAFLLTFHDCTIDIVMRLGCLVWLVKAMLMHAVIFQGNEAGNDKKPSFKTPVSMHYCILVCTRAECFQWDQDESGGGRYCETYFILSDNRFRNDIWSKLRVAHHPELSVFARGYSNWLYTAIRVRTETIQEAYDISRNGCHDLIFPWYIFLVWWREQLNGCMPMVFIKWSRNKCPHHHPADVQGQIE